MEIKINEIPHLFFPAKKYHGYNGKYFIDKYRQFFLKKCPERNIIRESTITELLNKNGCDWALTLVKTTKKFIITRFLDKSSYPNIDNIPDDYRHQIETILRDMKNLSIRHNDIYLKQFRILNGKIYLTDFGWGSFKETSEYKLDNSDRYNSYSILDKLYNKRKLNYGKQIRVLPYYSDLEIGSFNHNNLLIKLLLPPKLLTTKYLKLEPINTHDKFDLNLYNLEGNNYIEISNKNNQGWKYNLRLSHNLVYKENSYLELGRSKKNNKNFIVYSDNPIPKNINIKSADHDYSGRFKYNLIYRDQFFLIIKVKRVDQNSGWDHILPIIIS